jgi:hypothetical protein
MKRCIKDLKLILFLSLCVTFVNVPPDALAIPSESVSNFEAASTREAQIENIMSVLDRPEAQVHLMTMGLTKSELRGQLSQLDDSQLALVSEKADQVKAAGDGAGIVVFILVVILLVVLILFLMHRL